jgi:hypothetical protein
MKTLKSIALLVATLVTLSPLAASAGDSYEYELSHHNDSPASWSVSESDRQAERETYDTQTSINGTLDYLNSGSATSAPSSGGQETYDGN